MFVNNLSDQNVLVEIRYKYVKGASICNYKDLQNIFVTFGWIGTRLSVKYSSSILNVYSS
jgi:hypothetical protein